MVDYSLEREYAELGFRCVCGIDEAGRGSLAGPVCAAAVVLRDGAPIEGLDDSKKLTEKKREALFDVIRTLALDYSVAFADEKEIDELNILNAAFLAMRRAVNGLNLRPDLALVDGNQAPHTGLLEVAVVKGDAKCASIAAASVLAKVSRDRLMRKLVETYPQYGFERHKGYGTRLHYERLLRYGPSPVHRRSFLKNLEEKR